MDLRFSRGPDASTQALKSRQGGQKSQRVAVEEEAGKIQSVTGTRPTIADFEDGAGRGEGMNQEMQVLLGLELDPGPTVSKEIGV